MSLPSSSSGGVAMTSKKPKMNPLAKKLPYNERLRNYEREKQALLGSMRDRPAEEFAERLRQLQDKWGV